MTIPDASQPIALLAERPRVEERLLIEAFAARGHAARVVSPAALSFPLAGVSDAAPALALDRAPAAVERATLAALLAAGGTVVVNRAATARLLADRLALLRHLIVAGIAVPETRVAFGPEATLAAIEALGYPVILRTPVVDPGHPDSVVTDRDAAEALVEHRAVLGDERVTLVQELRYLPTPGYTVRLVVAGAEIVGVERLCHAEGAAYAPYPDAPAALAALGAAVVGRLVSGVYQIECVEAPDGPVVLGAGNLVDFRTLAETGIAGKIADFALAELARERG